MGPLDHDKSGDPTCQKCGQKLTLVGSLPKMIGSETRVRLYKCLACQSVIRIPPFE
jgi:DNA-directed RNA polymerase subunit M/transcription elongation factor TFIIS